MQCMLRAAVVVVPLVPCGTRAQAAATPDTAPPIALGRIAGAVQGGAWTYSSRMLAHGRSQDVGTRTLTVAPGTRGTASVWVVVDSQKSPMATAVDSLFVGRGDLAAVHRTMRLAGVMGEMTLTMDFTADSVTGEMRAGGQAKRLAMANVPGSVPADAVVLLVLGALPLRAGWSGTLPVLDPQTRGAVPLTLKVAGRASTRVPAGTFDAWVVEASAGPATAVYHVARGGAVVRVVASLPQAGDAAVETVLARAHAAP